MSDQKKDPMADRAPAHVLSERDPSKGPKIEVREPHYRTTLRGQRLDHRLYVEDDPKREFRFCSTNRPEFVARNRDRGFASHPDSEGQPVRVGNLELCSRPVEFKEQHDRLLQEEMARQTRKHSADVVREEALRETGLPATGGERIERNVPASKFVGS